MLSLNQSPSYKSSSFIYLGASELYITEQEYAVVGISSFAPNSFIVILERGFENVVEPPPVVVQLLPKQLVW